MGGRSCIRNGEWGKVRAVFSSSEILFFFFDSLHLPIKGLHSEITECLWIGKFSTKYRFMSLCLRKSIFGPLVLECRSNLSLK